jgi:hypothetical protein
LLHPLLGIAGLLLAPLFVLGSLDCVGPFEPRGLQAGRHAGAAGLHRLVLWLLALALDLLVTA